MPVDFLLGDSLNNGLYHPITNIVNDRTDWTGKRYLINTLSTHINQVKMLKGRFPCLRCLLTIDLWNSTRPPKPVSSSIQVLPSLDVNQANVGTWSLQEVAHDNTPWVRVCVCERGVASSFLFLPTVGGFFSLSKVNPQSREKINN